MNNTPLIHSAIDKALAMEPNNPSVPCLPSHIQ
jgi:hypothetical protein